MEPNVKYAIYLLEKRDYSEKELYKKISEKYSEQKAAEAVAYSVKCGYVDDERYARRLIEKYLARYGKKRVSAELFQKGIDKELSEQLLEEQYDLEQESEKIVALLRSKLKGAMPADRKESEKVFAFLCRKGYSSDEINHAFAEYKERI